ncbi:tryptophan 5-hydroxylase 1-like [Paramacrobiotus metropolitanus]|uniref:tryptophan 5-hydroxylase 1-like n=1 Tax=Paramacrobiotus metropolitanus TaxID=2943436 RepID=UPI002445E7D4|nr:tryptophan 5-hydroxylase 1-like [Paramacrobiotus metropolitanus]
MESHQRENVDPSGSDMASGRHVKSDSRPSPATATVNSDANRTNGSTHGRPYLGAMRQRAASTPNAHFNKLAAPNATGSVLHDLIEKDEMNNFAEESELFKKGTTKNTKSVVFSLKNELGSLANALTVFKEHDVNICRIESRQTKRSRGHEDECEVYVDVECDDRQMVQVCNLLKRRLTLAHQQSLSNMNAGGTLQRQATINDSTDLSDGDMCHLDTPEVYGMPWFPRRISDLDKSAHKVLMYGVELDADHPGFKDPVYRKRRLYFAELALKYKHGRPIPRVKYTEEETRTWGVVFSELMKLYPTHACRQVLENIPLLVRHCGYRVDNLPQLQDISRFLKERTGFTVRPVAGYLSSRDFLAGLAFRVFHCTQYIRHSSCPLYTPEPDCCHEIMGHIPLLADPCFAHFSQELGLASLGASDDEVDKLATCYFFTIEFGLCHQDGQLRAYGAGLLSSIGELQHVLSPAAKKLPFDPVVTCSQECMITTYQNVYFYSNSFDEAKEQMREFARTIRRPFNVRYNPYTQTVEILHSQQQITAMLSELRGDLAVASEALRKIRQEEGRKAAVTVTSIDFLRDYHGD